MAAEEGNVGDVLAAVRDGALLFVAADGTPYEQVPDQARQTVETYRSIVYDFLYGQGYITQALTQYGDP